MSSTVRVMPKARQAHLVVEELADETLVYDEDRHEAHCLNQTAAFVWKHCDGRTAVNRMARMLEGEMKAPVSNEVVLFALHQLEKSHLLELPRRQNGSQTPDLTPGIDPDVEYCDRRHGASGDVHCLARCRSSCNLHRRG